MHKKIALVTGASKGIGAAIAIDLAKQGFDIWLNYKSSHEDAKSVSKKIIEAGQSCQQLCFDVCNSKDVRSSLSPLLETQTPYVLVNNAGFTRDTLLSLMDVNEWKSVISVSLDGFFHVTKPVVTKMLRQRKGRIINIVSTSGQTGLAGQVNYSSAKAGLIGATKALAREVAKRNILVNAVSPGFIETEMTKDLPKEIISKIIPLKRFGNTEEIAGVVSFLCSDQASYITGQVISVNGGAYM